MTISPWTYRLLRSLLAAALLFGISLPVVRHVCGVTGDSVMLPAAMRTPHGGMTAPGAEGERPCGSAESADDEAAPCAEAGFAGEQDACCTIHEVERDVVTPLTAEVTAARLFLPVIAVLPDAIGYALRPLLPLPLRDTGQLLRQTPPLRVLLSSFLL